MRKRARVVSFVEESVVAVVSVVGAEVSGVVEESVAVEGSVRVVVGESVVAVEVLALGAAEPDPSLAAGAVVVGARDALGPRQIDITYLITGDKHKYDYHDHNHR